MSEIRSKEELKAAISRLENRLADEENTMKENFHQATESLAPINLIKSGLKMATESSDLKHAVVNSTVAIAAGYLSKLVFVGRSINPIKKFAGELVLVGVTNVIAKHPAILDKAERVVKVLLHKLKRSNENPDVNSNEPESRNP